METKFIYQSIHRISEEVQRMLVQQELTDQALGLQDGETIIKSYLDHHELGLAWEHLLYMISETGVKLKLKQRYDLRRMAKAMEYEPLDFLPLAPTILEDFYHLLQQFHLRQEEALDILSDKWNITFPKTCHEWIDWCIHAGKRKLPMNKEGVKIHPHGFGLSLSNGQFWIDFDFGENGEADGFDAWRLRRFAENNKISTPFQSGEEIQEVIAVETEKGALIFSGYINYYLNK
ncbi:MAG: hypothetical protein AAFP89_00035 [Bacteroidota bacterium]